LQVISLLTKLPGAERILSNGKIIKILWQTQTRCSWSSVLVGKTRFRNSDFKPYWIPSGRDLPLLPRHEASYYQGPPISRNIASWSRKI